MILNPVISIIIPVYNVEDYLHRCVDSILTQEFENWEILLINDGSTDSSSSICDTYAKNDLRIKVFHKENGGVSSARNLGIKMIRGKYVWFVDADDFILPNSLSLLYTFSENNNLDCVQFSYYNFISYTDEVKAAIDYETSVYPSLVDYGLHYVYSFEVWKIFIKVEILMLNSIFFSEDIKYAEDQEFVLKILTHSRRVATMSNVLYGYRQQRLGKAMSNIKICNIRDNLIVANNLLQLYSKMPECANSILLISVNYIVKNYFHFIAQSDCRIFDIIRLWSDYRSFFKNKYLPVYKKHKVLSKILYLCYYFPFIYIYSIRIFKRKC